MTPSLRLSSLCTALALSACARVGVTPVGPAPSVGACRAPDVDVRSWRVVDDPAGVRYRLPTGFNESSSPDLDFREFRVDRELSGRVMIGFSASTEHYMTLRRVPSPPMHEMSECVEGPEGGEALFQTWRTDGGLFRDGERHPLYEVHALIPVAPMRTLFITGGGSTSEFQAILLAIARSVEIDPS